MRSWQPRLHETEGLGLLQFDVALEMWRTTRTNLRGVQEYLHMLRPRQLPRRVVQGETPIACFRSLGWYSWHRRFPLACRIHK